MPRLRSSASTPGPERGALRGLDPDPEYVLDAVQVDTDRDMGGGVADLVVITDLDHQCVQVHDRVDRVQRPRLPGLHLIKDSVGDLCEVHAAFWTGDREEWK